MNTTNVSGGTAVALKHEPLAKRYEFRALAAYCRLARDRELSPADATSLLVEAHVAADVRSLAVAQAHAEELAKQFNFSTTRRAPDDTDRAMLRSQLGYAP